MEHLFVSTIDLPGGSLLPRVSATGETVRILRGRVWLTEEGSPGDVFLASGEHARLGGTGLAVIEALGPSRIELIEARHVSVFAEVACATAALLRHSARWFRRLRRAAARVIAPHQVGGTPR